MTRFFVSFYLFIALSLIVLSALLENLFFPTEHPVPSEHASFVQWIQANQHMEHLHASITAAGFNPQIIDSSSIAWLPEQQRQLDNNDVIRLYDEHALHLYVPITSNTLLSVSLPNQAIPQKTWLWYSGLFYFLLGLLIALWLWPLWRDIKRVKSELVEFNGQSAKRRLPIDNSSLIAPIAQALENLNQRIYELLQTQRELSGSVAHELRTPLSRIKFALAMQGENKHRASIEKDINELESLIQEMLDYSSLQVSQPSLEISEIPLDIMLHQLQERIAISKPSRIQIHIYPSEHKLFADGHLLERAIENLLLNALRYAKSRIEISVQHKKTVTQLTVEDDGEGIPNTLRDKIFEPFFRPDKGRDRQRGGAGMGLAIVNRIATWHQGRCWVEASEMGGAKFVLQLPNHD